MAVKLIASDLDGTLLTNKKNFLHVQEKPLIWRQHRESTLCRQRADPLVLYLR